jgi:transposase-like protein
MDATSAVADFSARGHPITSEIAFQCEEGKVCYFNGHLPVFIHDKKELATFRLFTSQLVINGNATQAQIARAFGVPLVTVKRYVKLYREGRDGGLFAPPKKRSASKLSPPVCQEVQALLDQGLEVPEVGRRMGILANNLHKAIRSGRLRRPKKKIHPARQAQAPRPIFDSSKN